MQRAKQLPLSNLSLPKTLSAGLHYETAQVWMRFLEGTGYYYNRLT